MNQIKYKSLYQIQASFSDNGLRALESRGEVGERGGGVVLQFLFFGCFSQVETVEFSRYPKKYFYAFRRKLLGYR